MRLKNRSGKHIVVAAGEDLTISRFMTWVGGENQTMKILSVDKLPDDYEPPMLASDPATSVGTTVATDGAGASTTTWPTQDEAVVRARREAGVEVVDGRYVCPAPDCGFVSTSERGVKCHHTKIHGFPLDAPTPAPEDPVACPACRDEFRTETGMKRHFSMVHGERYDDVHGPAREFVCPECGDLFLTEHGRKVHFGHRHEGSLAETRTTT